MCLPTEDEHEAAFGEAMFFWGNEVPKGRPLRDKTSFVGHQEQTGRGLLPLGDPYHTELTWTALKHGDGGEALCGHYPWPIPWFSFCPSFRLAGQEEYIARTKPRFAPDEILG